MSQPPLPVFCTSRRTSLTASLHTKGGQPTVVLYSASIAEKRFVLRTLKEIIQYGVALHLFRAV